jgi:hypothetical protein
MDRVKLIRFEIDFSIFHLCCKVTVLFYRVIRAQADWTLILPSATSCERAVPLAEKNAATRPELLAHTVYFFR